MRYMLISFFILFMAMLPFFSLYERRKPRAREVVIIAMYTAITVSAQIFFRMTVPIQIMTALVIIAGISLGPEAGFLIGALSRFVANFYMGQGPWTPWQMATYGFVGFFAGLAFNKAEVVNKFEAISGEREEIESLKSRDFTVIMGPVITIALGVVLAYVSYLIYPWNDETFWGWRVYAGGLLGLIAGVAVQRKKLPIDYITLTVFTFFVTIIVYGGVMNIAAMMTMPAAGGMPISFKTLRLLYVSGLPYDFYHASTAAFSIFVIGHPMIKKIERIKVKYGIYRR